MPTYTHECIKDNCKHRFETTQKITEDLIIKCPRCGGFTNHIVVPGSGFILKGEKWFKNSGEY